MSAGGHRRRAAPAWGSTGAGTACAEQLGPDLAAAAPWKRRKRGVTGEGGGRGPLSAPHVFFPNTYLTPSPSFAVPHQTVGDGANAGDGAEACPGDNAEAEAGNGAEVGDSTEASESAEAGDCADAGFGADAGQGAEVDNGETLLLQGQ